MQTYKITLNNIEIEFGLISAEKIDRYHYMISTENPNAEELIFKEITNNKYDINDLNAGIIPTVVFASIMKSGRLAKRDDFANKIEEYRPVVNNNAYYILYGSIIKYIPAYTLEILKTKSINELFELFALAEFIKGEHIADVDKIRQLLSDEPKTGNLKKRGISSITKEELNALKAALQCEEFEGMPIADV
ncbi:MAG: hypothetical protein RBR68_13795 [Tenuifilaceae bacterium]|nr:hypothetical protein [Tenuifilaceae bacterium]